MVLVETGREIMSEVVLVKVEREMAEVEKEVVVAEKEVVVEKGVALVVEGMVSVVVPVWMSKCNPHLS